MEGFVNKDFTDAGGISGGDIAFAGGISGGDIALAPTNNIFLINQDNSQKSSPTIIQGGDTIVIGGKSVNPYDISLNIAMMESLQTA